LRKEKHQRVIWKNQDMCSFSKKLSPVIKLCYWPRPRTTTLPTPPQLAIVSSCPPTLGLRHHKGPAYTHWLQSLPTNDQQAKNNRSKP
jgi:hypothetical protein